MWRIDGTRLPPPKPTETSRCRIALRISAMLPVFILIESSYLKHSEEPLTSKRPVNKSRMWLPLALLFRHALRFWCGSLRNVANPWIDIPCIRAKFRTLVQKVFLSVLCHFLWCNCVIFISAFCWSCWISTSGVFCSTAYSWNVTSIGVFSTIPCWEENLSFVKVPTSGKNGVKIICNEFSSLLVPR